MSKALRRSPFTLNHIVLKDFARRYDFMFQLGSLTQFACLYYPVAHLELNILEMTSEEFDTIEHVVLELYAAGLNSKEFIADVLGIPIGYVGKILRILEGYGHISNGSLTELGHQSLSEEKMVTRYLTRQKVQADPLAGLAFSKAMYQSNLSLFSSEDTNPRISHLMPGAFLQPDLFDKLKSCIQEMKSSQKGIFHVNVEEIVDIVSRETKFTYAFLVKFDYCLPFVIVKCREFEPTNGAPIYYWKPIAIASSLCSLLKQRGIQHDLETASDAYFETLSQQSDEIVRRAADIMQKQGFQETVLPEMITKLQDYLTFDQAFPYYVGFARNDQLPGVVYDRNKSTYDDIWSNIMGKVL